MSRNNRQERHLRPVDIQPIPPGKRIRLPTETIKRFNAVLTEQEVRGELSSTRAKELRMKTSAGLGEFTEEDFASGRADGFVTKLRCYSNVSDKRGEHGRRKLIPATEEEILALRKDPTGLSTFEDVGAHLYKRAFWRAVEHVPDLVIPTVVIVSEHINTRRDIKELAEKELERLIKLGNAMAGLTNIYDPGVRVNGITDPEYLL